jgi:hypothetical protein
MKRLKQFLLTVLGLLLVLILPLQAQQSVFVPATQASVLFGSTTIAITKIISAISGKSIYLTQLTIKPANTSVVTLSYGSGTNCGTGTQAFYGPVTFGTGESVYLGTGNGALFVVPQSKDVCATVSTAIAPGWVSYSQF